MTKPDKTLNLDNLPADMKTLIFSYLPPNERTRLALVNKALYTHTRATLYFPVKPRLFWASKNKKIDIFDAKLIYLACYCQTALFDMLCLLSDNQKEALVTHLMGSLCDFRRSDYRFLATALSNCLDSLPNDNAVRCNTIDKLSAQLLEDLDCDNKINEGLGAAIVLGKLKIRPTNTKFTDAVKSLITVLNDPSENKSKKIGAKEAFVMLAYLNSQLEPEQVNLVIDKLKMEAVNPNHLYSTELACVMGRFMKYLPVETQQEYKFSLLPYIDGLSYFNRLHHSYFCTLHGAAKVEYLQKILKKFIEEYKTLDKFIQECIWQASELLYELVYVLDPNDLQSMINNLLENKYSAVYNNINYILAEALLAQSDENYSANLAKVFELFNSEEHLPQKRIRALIIFAKIFDRLNDQDVQTIIQRIIPIINQAIKNKKWREIQHTLELLAKCTTKIKDDDVKPIVERLLEEIGQRKNNYIQLPRLKVLLSLAHRLDPELKIRCFHEFKAAIKYNPLNENYRSSRSDERDSSIHYVALEGIAMLGRFLHASLDVVELTKGFASVVPVPEDILNMLGQPQPAKVGGLITQIASLTI